MAVKIRKFRMKAIVWKKEREYSARVGWKFKIKLEANCQRKVKGSKVVSMRMSELFRSFNEKETWMKINVVSARIYYEQSPCKISEQTKFII